MYAVMLSLAAHHGWLYSHDRQKQTKQLMQLN